MSEGVTIDIFPAPIGGWEIEGQFNDDHFSIYGNTLPAALRGVATRIEELSRTKPNHLTEIYYVQYG